MPNDFNNESTMFGHLEKVNNDYSGNNNNNGGGFN